MKRLIRLIALVAIAAGGPAAAGAYTLSGRITNNQGVGVHPLDIDVHDSQSGVLVPTPGDTTNALGYYSIALPAGRYDVRFVPAVASHLFTDERKGVQMNGDVIINRTLASGQRASGRVTRLDGSGVAGVNLDFRDAATGVAANNVQDDLTDANGFFTALVDPGTWDVLAIPLIADHLVPVVVPAVNLLVDREIGTITCGPGFVVSATVTDIGYFPIADADFDVKPAAGGPKLFTPQDNTDPTGAATLVVPPGVWNFVASPPPGQPYATRTARNVSVNADLALPNLELPPGVALTAHCQTVAGAAVSGVDLDVDSLPVPRRLETPNDVTDASGNLAVLVPTGPFRLTFSPTVASRLLPTRFDSVYVSGPVGLGNVVLQAGHWVSVTVVEQGSNAPIAGANLDFVRLASGQPAITPGDVTDGAGFARVTTDADLYRLRITPPSATWDGAEVAPFRSLSDTAIVVSLRLHAAAVAPERQGALALSSPWPNPARGVVRVVVRSAHGRDLELSAWDAAGRRLGTLWRGRVSGSVNVAWDPRDASGALLPAGLYWLRLSDGSASTARRVVIVP